MKTFSFLMTAFLLFNSVIFAQVGISSDNTSPDPSAMLDVKSTSKGFLPPRMSTTQMYLIPSPSAGLMVFNTTLSMICWYNGTAWVLLDNNDGKSCGSVSYGGKTYNSVIIGFQCWMNENLNIGVSIAGSQNQTNNGTIERYCYGNNPALCDIYGGLYQWGEMVQYFNGATNLTSWSPVPTGNVQGICPAGWHLPTDADWATLVNYLGGESVAGGKLKEAGTLHWMAANATNSSGFTALPGGFRYGDGNFYFHFSNGYFYSASESAAASGWVRTMGSGNTNVGREGDDKAFGMAVRCLQD